MAEIDIEEILSRMTVAEKCDITAGLQILILVDMCHLLKLR